MTNQTYNDVLSELQDYILDEKNIDRALEMKIISLTKPKTQKTIETQKNNLFVPIENDSLFWCFYIIKNGDMKYEMMNHKNVFSAKQLKISYVETIRKYKKTVKTHKFDTISNVESNLVNDNIINIKTFLTLCTLENINIIYVSKKTYFELLMNDDGDIYIVHEINNSKNGNYKIKYGFELGNIETINNIKNTLYKLDKIDKPIKAISSYTIQELVNICQKLAIETVDKNKNKTKSKKDLYEEIIQFF